MRHRIVFASIFLATVAAVVGILAIAESPRYLLASREVRMSACGWTTMLGGSQKFDLAFFGTSRVLRGIVPSVASRRSGLEHVANFAQPGRSIARDVFFAESLLARGRVDAIVLEFSIPKTAWSERIPRVPQIDAYSNTFATEVPLTDIVGDIASRPTLPIYLRLSDALYFIHARLSKTFQRIVTGVVRQPEILEAIDQERNGEPCYFSKPQSEKEAMRMSEYNQNIALAPHRIELIEKAPIERIAFYIRRLIAEAKSQGVPVALLIAPEYDADAVRGKTAKRLGRMFGVPIVVQDKASLNDFRKAELYRNETHLKESGARDFTQWTVQRLEDLGVI